VTFLAPIFFAGLLAVGLPLWLHRLSSENPNKQVFSSLMLLEPGEPRRVLAKNLQYLLLLALRIAVLALLVFAFAGPAILRAPSAAISEDSRLHLIVLDVSASMAYGNRWDAAQDAAVEIIDALGSDDRGQVIAAGRITELLTQETPDPSVLRSAVSAAEPGVFQLSFGQLMRSLDGLVRAADLPVVLHVVTDGQATGLPLRFAELAPREAAEVVIHDVASDEQRPSNWAVESLGGSPITGELQATIAGFADADATRTVRLELEGALVDQQTVTVPAGGRAQVEFAPLELRSGSNRVSVTLSPADGLAADDARYIALQRPEPRSVLVVSDDLRGRDTLFVLSALETLAALVVDAETISSQDIVDRTLADYHFVVVMDAGGLGVRAAAALRDYVESGGAVLMAMGPRSTALTAVPVTEQLLQTGGTLRGNEYVAVGAMDVGHPALRGLESIRGARFTRYATIEPAAEDEVLMSLETGPPLLIERELGAGQVLVYASTLDRQWNDLVVQPVFVPFISGLANHMLGGAGFTSEADLGSTLAVRALGFSGGQIFDPAGDVALGLGGTEDVLLDKIGFYEVVGGGVSQLVAVNFDVLESDLATMDGATIDRWQRLGIGPGEAANAALAVEDEEAATPSPIGLWVLGLLVVAVVMESWAGNWHLRVRRGMAA